MCYEENQLKLIKNQIMLKSKRALVLSVISLLGSLVSLAGSEYRTSSNGSNSNADSSHYEYNDGAFVNHSSNVIEQISPKSLKNLRHIKPSSPSFTLNAKTAGNQYAIDDDLNSTQATYSSVGPSPMVAALRRHSAIGTHSEPPHVKFAILLPEKPRNRRDVRILSTIRPVIEMATRVVTGPEGVLRNVRIEIDYRDTQCSSTYGALGAFDIFLKRKPGGLGWARGPAPIESNEIYWPDITSPKNGFPLINHTTTIFN